MCIAALFIIAPNWKQPKCPSTDEWKSQICIHTKEYYSLMRRNEVLIQATARMNLENIRLVKEATHKDHILYDSIYMKYPD